MSGNMYDEKGMLKPEYNQKTEKLVYPKEPIDVRTDFGKGITYKSVDGKDWATYEDAMAYNQMYYEKLMIQLEEEKGMRR